jgi:hypothetical protein
MISDVYFYGDILINDLQMRGQKQLLLANIFAAR